MAKKTLKERMQKKLEDQKSKRQSGAIYFIKPDTEIRMRILSMGEEEEFIKEVEQFYLGNDIKGVISPSTFGEPCGITEGYEELKNSDNDDDRELANKFVPRKKYLPFCAIYKDLKGKEVDEQLSPKFVLCASGTYQDILELYLDENEWGDMTDPDDGYDIKIKRTGSGKKDTVYKVTACKNTRAPKGFRKTYDLDEEVRKVIPSYEQTKILLDQFLGLDPEDNEPKKKKIIKKKRRSDLDE